jgi:hemerythrin superfamily protein
MIRAYLGYRFRDHPGGAVSTDAIVLLKQDHKEIRNLFRQFHQTAEDATEQQGQIVDQILEALTVHTYIENECMYPRVLEHMAGLTDDVLESHEEHHIADVLCLELAALRPDSDRFRAKTTVLIESVTHHMDEEEQDWFPKVREGLGRKQLQELGAELIELKKKAPRSPAQPSALKKAVDALIK